MNNEVYNTIENYAKNTGNIEAILYLLKKDSKQYNKKNENKLEPIYNINGSNIR